ncbi:MAG TPA: glycosyltransferase family 39 protein [Gaiellaceae bacterium]|nr:glycosyltransferase family 39 protein [Gaiellaceae bacterium]
MSGQSSRAVLGVLGLSLASLVLRTRSLDGTLWIDEAISRGIASHPIDAIPGLLRQDGSPPLYYVLLHGWMAIAGEGEVALRSLSLVFAVAAVPAAFWVGRTVGGERVAWIAAVLAAFNPFLTVYGQEARMYSLVAFLSILATGAFVRGFVDGSRAAQVVFAAVLGLLLYTHAWATFFVIGVVAALAVRRWRRLSAAAGIGAVAAAVALFVPWLPSLIDQARHTGAPWSSTPSLLDLLGGFPASLDRGIGAAAVFAAGAAGLVSFRRGDRRERTVLAAIGALAAVTLSVAWLASQLEPSWANRYLAIIVGPVVVLGAVGLARLGAAGAVAVAVAVALWIGFRAPADKSNAEAVAAAVASAVPSGALIVSTQPEQVPLLDYYLAAPYPYATPLGPVPRRSVFDWRNALERLRGARVERQLDPLVEGLSRGDRLVLVQPLGGGRGWQAPWQRAVLAKSAEWRERLDADKRLRNASKIAPPARGRTSVSATIYVRR